MKKTLLFVAAMAGTFSFILPAHADHAVLSPKAKELRNALRTVPGITTFDLIDRSIQPGSPKGREMENSNRKVSNTVFPSGIVYTSQQLAPATKDPRYEYATHNNEFHEVEVEIVPLK